MNRGDLRKAWETGVAAWPGVEVPEETFVAHLATKLEGSDPAAVDQLRCDELYLATGCAVGVPSAIAAFHKEYLMAVDPALRRIGLEAPNRDEVIQRLAERLLLTTDGPPRIATYDGRGPLRSWVRVAAVRLASNFRQAEQRETAVLSGDLGGDITEAPAVSASAERALDRRRFGPALERAVKAALVQLAAEDRLLLRQHLVDGLSTVDLAALHRLHRTTLLRRIQNLRKRLQRRIHAELSTELRIDKRDLDSFIRDLRSDIGISVASALAS
jgi:RNA polymerase sigma-70 factor (ECF subfamily)